MLVDGPFEGPFEGSVTHKRRTGSQVVETAPPRLPLAAIVEGRVEGLEQDGDEHLLASETIVVRLHPQ